MDIDDILREFEESSTNELQASTSNICQELITVVTNERMAPELLPYKASLMNSILTHISNQQQYLLDSHEYGEMNSANGVISSDFKLQLMIVETDVERLSYIVRLYLRTRLSKINKFTIFYINKSNREDDGGGDLLSAEEKEYIHQYYSLLTSLYNNCFLKKLPQILTFLDDSSGGQNMVVAPDLDQFVFVKCTSEASILLHLEDDELELVKNGVYVVKYSLIKRHLEIGDLILI